MRHESLAVSSEPRKELPSLTDLNGNFGRNYNRFHFQFPHGLKGSSLFELPCLIQLAQRMPDQRDIYWSNGKVVVQDAWGVSRDPRLSLVDTIANIAENNSLVILKHTEQDPFYGPLLQNFLAKVVELCGSQMGSDVAVGEVLILISSPNRVTPFHIDKEANFLIQVKGDKTLWVFDPDDRTLVSHADLEQFFAGNHSVATYKPEKQAEATSYNLRAGYGVHIPVFAPHWVQNHNNISIALSVNYELNSIRRIGRLYRVNGLLRKARIRPRPPGASRRSDVLKTVCANTLYTGYRFISRKEKPFYPSWTPS